MLKFLGRYREAGLLLLRASIGLISILICAPALFAGDRRWVQFGSAMRVFHFHSHLDWWGLTGVLLGCIGGILILFGLAFRLGLLFVFLVALVHALNVSRHDHGLDLALVPIEAVIILFCLALIGPGQYSVDKS